MTGDPYLNNAGLFLIRTLFDLYTAAVLLRFLLQWVRADFYNPLVQFLVKITNPPLLPLRRVIPGYMGLDLAAVVLMLALQIVKLLLVLAILGQGFNLGGLTVLALAELLNLLLYVLIGSLIIQAILSWVNPDPYQPVVALLYQLTEPLLRPVRGLLPLIEGIDLSPLVALLILYLVQMLLVERLWNIGMTLLAG